MFRLFDFAIICYSAFAFFIVYSLIRHFLKLKKFSKITKKHWQISVFLFFWLTGSIMFYGSFIEPQQINISHTTINLDKTDQHKKIKVAFIADFHLGPYKKAEFLQKIIKKTIAEKPDLILLGGDFIHTKESEGKYFTNLNQLTAIAPVYAIFGNHEYHVDYKHRGELVDKTKILREVLKNANVKLMENNVWLLTINGAKFNLVGLDVVDADRDDYKKAVANIDATAPQIVLSHTPDIILKNIASADLILSGHTHGGQIRLPGIGAIPEIPTFLGRQYDEGLFNLGDQQLFITRGVGESGTRARLFCPPEISILTIDL